MNKSVHAVSDIFFQKLFSSLDIFNLRCNIFLIKEGFIYLSSYIYIYIYSSQFQQIYIVATSILLFSIEDIEYINIYFVKKKKSLNKNRNDRSLRNGRRFDLQTKYSITNSTRIYSTIFTSQ